FSIVVPKAPVSAFLGSSVILPCNLSPSINARTFEVRWYKNGEHEKPVLFYKEKKNTGQSQDRDRVSLIGELDNRNVSLKLDHLTMADSGEYTCFVKSLSWYEKGSMNLAVKVLGSTPLLLYHESVEKMNVTCRSFGWSPKPTLTWRDSTGRELPNTHTKYTTDSEGLVNVSSWLLFSPSDSEWISCTVGLNLQEIKESRIVPMKGFKVKSVEGSGDHSEEGVRNGCVEVPVSKRSHKIGGLLTTSPKKLMDIYTGKVPHLQSRVTHLLTPIFCMNVNEWCEVHTKVHEFSIKFSSVREHHHHCTV
ncbi:butyrophilin-like, partial [Silurus meridionalis]